MINLPQSTPFRERYVKVIAKIQTWCIVEDILTFDTETKQFEIPNGYQVDAEVVAWKYADPKRNTNEILDNYTPNESPNVLRRYGHTYFEIGIVTETIYKIFEEVNNDLLEYDADFLYDEKDETLKIIEKILKSEQK